MRWIRMGIEDIRQNADAPGWSLVLKELGGQRSLSVLLDPDEGGLLDAEINGAHTRLSHTYLLVEEVLHALGARIRALRLTVTGGGLWGEVDAGRGRRRAHVQAHPGDVVVLGRRLSRPILVPEDLLRSEPVAPGLPYRGEIEAFKTFLERVRPDDFGNLGRG